MLVIFEANENAIVQLIRECNFLIPSSTPRGTSEISAQWISMTMEYWRTQQAQGMLVASVDN